MSARWLGSLGVCAAALLWAAGTVRAQDPDPTQWDIEIRTDKNKYEEGDTLSVTTGMVARETGVQGWSYGVKHDPAVLTIGTATSVGTDVDSVFSGGFRLENTDLQQGTNAGFIQAIVLSFLGGAEVPQSSFFSMAAVTYTVNESVCSGKQDFPTTIEYTNDLSAKGSPPAEINLTVAGKGFVPATIENAEPTIQCKGGVLPSELAIVLDDTVTRLKADTVATYDLKVQLVNPAESSALDILGWSYGITIDTADVEAISGESGADAAALNGGSGPDFVNYILDETDGGSLTGITVGGVISLAAPATATLPMPVDSRKHIDTIVLKSAEVLAPGSSKITVIGFSDLLGTGNTGQSRPVEVLVTLENGDSLVPDFTDTLDLELYNDEAPDKPVFIRGDANNDARVDIADGVWIINELFYAGPETACRPAADSNADQKVDLSDAMYIFQWRLQPGATSSSLFPSPPAPFPNCGQADDATFDNCPMGSTTCP